MPKLTLRLCVRTLLYALALLNASLFAAAQDSTAVPSSSSKDLSSQTLDRLNRQFTSMGSEISARSVCLLNNLQKTEARMEQKTMHKDSSTAGQLFTGAKQTYAQLFAKLQQAGSPTSTVGLKQYLPGLDSISTALKYIQQSNLSLPTEKLQKIQQLSSTLQSLQGRLQVATEIQTFASQREQWLKSQLSNMGMANQLLGMNKQVYYYQQQIAQYKNILHDPQQAEQAVIGAVRKIPAFQRYMDKYGYMGSNFPTPANYNTPQTLQGLQSRASVSKLLQSHMGTQEQADAATPNTAAATTTTTPPLPSPQEFQQQKVDQAKSALDKLKQNLSHAGLSTGNSNMTMPDFQPNSQRSKSFWKRWAVGFNIQTQGATTLLPSIAAIGASLGYKLNDKLTLGGGLSYNLGLGNSISNIHFSSQGISLRSFVDVKIKGSWWGTGAFEKNYMQAFSSLQDLKHHPELWQNSALLGITKKYHLRRTTVNIQLLYDLLATYHTPATQPVLFRIGYTL